MYLFPESSRMLIWNKYYVDVCLSTAGNDSVTSVNESDTEAMESQTSPPSTLPVIRQSGSSSAIDDVTAYVDAAAIATMPVAHGDIVVDMSRDDIQVIPNNYCVTSWDVLNFH